MRKAILLIIFSFITNLSLFAQHSNFAFYIQNPIALYNRAGFKVEFKTEKIGIAFFGTDYYGNYPQFLGTQAGLELRTYLGDDSTKRNQTFLYTKFLKGHQQHQERLGESSIYWEAEEGNYSGLGFGIGKHYNKKHFFIDVNAGVKFCVSNAEQEIDYYLYGPGSYIDLHFNIGFQTDFRKRNRWYTDSNTPK